MTNPEILKKAIEKAKNNGFNKKEPYYIYPDDIAGICIGEINQPCILETCFLTDLIFSHDFAKAFWGEELIIVDEHYVGDKVSKDEVINTSATKGEYVQTWVLEFPKWKLHLREMVLEENPLKYLEKFLDE